MMVVKPTGTTNGKKYPGIILELKKSLIKHNRKTIVLRRVIQIPFKIICL